MDQFYFEEGYFDTKYFVYTASAELKLDPYIDDFITIDYFEYKGSFASLSATLSQVLAQEGNASLAAAATVTVTIGYLRDQSSNQSSAFTQTASAGKILEFACDFGALFSPSFTATGFRNHTAVLDSAFTIAIDAVSNKAATLALDNIVNVSSQAQRFVGITSNQNSTATISTTAIKTSTASSTQSSAFSQSVDALNVQFAEISLSTAVRCSARGFKRYERALQIKTQTGEISSAEKKFGSGSAIFGKDSEIEYYATALDTEISGECWINFAANGTSPAFFLYGDDDGLGNFDILFRIRRTFSNTISFDLRNSAETGLLTLTSTSTYATANTWAHIAFALNRSTRQATLWVDGTQYINGTFASIGWSSTKNLLQLGFTGSPSVSSIYIDEAHLQSGSSGFLSSIGRSIGSSTITVPTSAKTNTSNTNFLGHFNTDFSDDISLLQSGQATLTSAFTSTTVASKSVVTASNQSITANISVTATKITENASSQSLSFTQTTDNIRVRFFDSSQSSAFTKSAIIGSIKQFDSTNNALFTPSITAEGRLVGIALVSASTTISITAEKTAVAQSTLTSSITQSASAVKSTDADSALSCVISQTVTEQRFRTFDSALSSEFTQASQEIYNVGFGVLLITAVTISADVLKLRRTSSDQSSAFTQNVSVIKTTDTDSAQSLSTQQNTDSDRIRGLESSQTVIVSMTSDAVKTTDIAETLSVVTAETAQAFKTTDVAVNHITLFGSSIDADITARPLVYLETQASLSVIIGSIKQFDTGDNWINYGVRSFDESKFPAVLMNFGVNNQIMPKENGYTLSIWAKRDSINSGFEPIVSNEPGSTAGGGLGAFFDAQGPTFAFTFNGTDVMLRQNFDPDEPNPTWTNVSTDTEWHHYLFHTSWKGAGSEDPATIYYRLWIDGVYQGERQYYAYNESVVFNGTEFLRLGSSHLRSLTGGYEIEFVGNDAGFAQLWMGYTPQDGSYNPPVEYFYDGGYVELYDDGRGIGDRLPQPKVYSRLDQTWTDVTFLGGYDNSEKRASIPLASDWQSYFLLNGQPVAVFIFVIDLFTTSQMQSTALVNKTLTASLSTAVSMTVDPETRIGIVANLATEFTAAATAGRIPTYIVSTASQATLSATIGFFQQAEAQLSDQFDFVCDFDAVPPTRGEADLVSAFTLSADAQSFTDAIIINTAFGTVVCDITVIPPIRTGADLTVTATMSVTIGSIEQFAVLTASLGTMTIAPVKTASADSTQIVTATVQATPTKFTGIILTLYAFDSVLVAGDIINIDPYLTLWIKPESRTYEIPAETRIITILQETRVNIIEGYSQ